MDGYSRLAVIGFLLFILIVSIFNIDCASKLFLGTVLMSILYGLFSLAWLVVGAVMFWGNIYSGGNCSESITIYMFANLILGFLGWGILGVGCMVINGKKKWSSKQWFIIGYQTYQVNLVYHWSHSLMDLKLIIKFHGEIFSSFHEKVWCSSGNELWKKMQVSEPHLKSMINKEDSMDAFSWFYFSFLQP